MAPRWPPSCGSGWPPGRGAVLREIVVLGRHGERGGRYRGELSVDVGGHPLLAHRTLLDGADPVLCGPAGTAGARAVGTLRAGRRGCDRRDRDTGTGDEPGLRWAWTELPGPGTGCCWPWGSRARWSSCSTGPPRPPGDVRRRSGERISDAQRRRKATRLDCGNTADMLASKASKCRLMAGTATSRARS